jgi:hypothetical protein
LKLGAIDRDALRIGDQRPHRRAVQAVIIIVDDRKRPLCLDQRAPRAAARLDPGADARSESIGFGLGKPLLLDMLLAQPHVDQRRECDLLGAGGNRHDDAPQRRQDQLHDFPSRARRPSGDPCLKWEYRFSSARRALSVVGLLGLAAAGGLALGAIG